MVLSSSYHIWMTHGTSSMAMFLPGAPSRLLPLRGIDRQRIHLAGLRVEERSVMREPSVSEELRQRRQCARGERLIDKRFLPVGCLDC